MALDAVDPEEQKEVAVSLGYLDAKLRTLQSLAHGSPIHIVY